METGRLFEPLDGCHTAGRFRNDVNISEQSLPPPYPILRSSNSLHQLAIDDWMIIDDPFGSVIYLLNIMVFHSDGTHVHALK